MKTTAIISIARVILRTLERRQVRKEASRLARAQRKADRRRDSDETRVWLADWQADRLNADLRDAVRRKCRETVRIDLLGLDPTHHKATKLTKERK